MKGWQRGQAGKDVAMETVICSLFSLDSMDKQQEKHGCGHDELWKLRQFSTLVFAPPQISLPSLTRLTSPY